MIRSYKKYKPKIHSSAYVSQQALVVGKVSLAKNVSIWPGCVLRGDVEDILINENTNLQDGVLVHTNYNLPTIIDRDVTVGHGCILHGCKIGSNCLIGMGAIILDGAVIEDNCIIGAGSVVTEGAHVKERSLVLGVPGRVARPLSDEELKKIKENAEEYIRLKDIYAKV
ncbi:MAG: gamma carbonic anhydrase family protein [Endomicrobiales bacterium]|nr:gamma carbonic anhydrase family protein [Endomicrobiales bacterium]